MTLNIISQNNTLVVDSRSIAQDLGIEHESFIRTVKKYETEIQEFGILRFQIGEINGRGRPEIFCYLNEDQATLIATFSRNTEQVIQFKVSLVKAFSEAKKALTELAQPEKKRAIDHYADRVVNLKTALKVPKGMWCVIQECSYLLLDVERAGYPVDKFDLLDGSIGKRYSTYRKDKEWYIEPDKAFYHHNGNYVQINAYPMTEIYHFKVWLQEIYEPNHLPVYLKEKYGSIVAI